MGPSDKKKILIIDDEEDLRDIVQFQLKTKGYEILTAQDGIDGLNKLKEFDPDLIILDLNMPRMGGIEFYQKICDKEGRPSHPVLVLTARANTRQLFLEFDIDGFMTKPFEAEDLIKESEIIIQKAEKESTLKEVVGLRAIKNICIVDSSTDDLDKISTALSRGGYKVSTANSGTKAIEKIMMNVPDLALINLGLTDVPGDIVVHRLMRMAKTKDIKFILYLDGKDHDKNILEGFSKKTGVIGCFEYTNVNELLQAIDRVLIDTKKEYDK